MRGVNRVFLVGRVGQDPEVRHSKAGEPWCKFSLATNRNRKGGDGNWSEETDWHSVRAFGRTAEQCMQYVGRGRMLAIEGSISYRKWKDDDGNTRVATSILADRVEFLDKKPEVEAAGPRRQAPNVPETAIPF